MFNFIPNNKTLFIVGAGASFEADLPVGEGLKKKISSLLNISTDETGNVKTKVAGSGLTFYINKVECRL